MQSKVIILLLIIVFALSAYCMYGVYDNGARISETRKQLESTIAEQRDIINRLEKVQNDIGRSANEVGVIKDTVVVVTDRIGENESRLKSDNELIRESQSILKAVRERN